MFPFETLCHTFYQANVERDNSWVYRQQDSGVFLVNIDRFFLKVFGDSFLGLIGADLFTFNMMLFLLSSDELTSRQSLPELILFSLFEFDLMFVSFVLVFELLNRRIFLLPVPGPDSNYAIIEIDWLWGLLSWFVVLLLKFITHLWKLYWNLFSHDFNATFSDGYGICELDGELLRLMILSFEIN